MLRSARILLLVLATLPLLGCASGDECDTCDSDADCQGGLVCVGFEDNSRRCGSGIGATTCRTR